MSKLGLAFRTFFRLLSDASFAARMAELDSGEETAEPATAPAPRRDQRSSALTLLATLQREARFIDFVMEPLDGYPDDQVGAAARDVQRDCAAVVRRIFAPEPLMSEPEGSTVQVPVSFDPQRYQLAGEVAGEPPFGGTLRHHGWRAAKCEMPSWAGEDDSATVVAPAQVEI